MPDRLNILFICGRNQRRSPTAAAIFRDDPRMSVRSAGTSESSRRKVGMPDLEWADIVLVMENRYAQRINARFPGHPARIIALDIPDDYDFMDAELVDLLQNCVNEILLR